MSDVIAIRIPKHLKKEFLELYPNYADDLRSYIELEVKRKKVEKALEEAEKYRKDLAKKIGLTASSAELIQENREHGC